MKGTGFSPYIRQRRVRGLEPLRECRVPHPCEARVGEQELN